MEKPSEITRYLDAVKLKLPLDEADESLRNTLESFGILPTLPSAAAVTTITFSCDGRHRVDICVTAVRSGRFLRYAGAKARQWLTIVWRSRQNIAQIARQTNRRLGKMPMGAEAGESEKTTSWRGP